MGGAQPLAATMAGYSALVVECDESRIDFRIKTRYVDKKATNLDDALSIIKDATAKGEAISVGLLGNAADIFPELVKRGIVPDVVTDQTSAHDPLNGYLPIGWTMEYAAEMRLKDEAVVVKAAKKSMAIQVQAMLDLQAAGSATTDYGNNIRQMALEEGVKNAAFDSFLLFYNNQILGVSATKTAIALGIAVLFDAISDPLAGSISDRFKSRWGRRHPFMLASAAPMAITLF